MRNFIQGNHSFLLTLTLTLTLFSPYLKAQTQTGTAQSYEYQIGAKDLLEISVFEVPELNITVRVSPGHGVAWPRVALQLEWPPALASSVMHRNWPRAEIDPVEAPPPMRQR